MSVDSDSVLNPPPPVEPPPGPVDSVNPIQAALKHESNYLPAEEWFSDIQDDGIELTQTEVEVWRDKPTKRKTGYITANGKHYKKLYGLSKKLHNLYFLKPALFSKILKNKSDCITAIGKYIADKRYSTKRADIHTHTESELKEFAAMNEHQNLLTLHFIRQRDVLKQFLEKWSGKSVADQMLITDGDRLRAVGLLMKSDLRDKIMYLLPVVNKSDRHLLDSFKGEKLRLKHILHQQYIDVECVVALPSKWFDENTKEKIDNKAFSSGTSWVELDKRFNVNNNARLALPWTKDTVYTMVMDTILKYNKVMVDYSKNTGGGSGDESEIVIWQDRDEVSFVNYDEKVKNCIYLTIVHMWSRMYNDPLVVVRDDIPPDCQIEDGGIDATSRGSRVSSTTTGTNATGDNSRSQQNQALITAINKIAGTDGLATENERTAVATIKETMELVNKCESDIKKYKSDRNKKRKRHPNNQTKMETINKSSNRKLITRKQSLSP